MSSDLQPIMPDRVRPANDAVERALAEVGDRWSFLILREAFFGVRRFDGFVAATGMAKNIASDRLKKLTAVGIFEKRRYSDHKSRFEYRLTQKGRDLYPVIVLLLQWGERWTAPEPGARLRLRHRTCGNALDAEIVCRACGGAVRSGDVDWEATE